MRCSGTSTCNTSRGDAVPPAASTQRTTSSHVVAVQPVALDAAPARPASSWAQFGSASSALSVAASLAALHSPGNSCVTRLCLKVRLPLSINFRRSSVPTTARCSALLSPPVRHLCRRGLNNDTAQIRTSVLPPSAPLRPPGMVSVNRPSIGFVRPSDVAVQQVLLAS